MTGLTKESTTFAGLSQDPYASIPVYFNKNSKEIELLIFGNPYTATKADYAQTIAAGLDLLLTEFIPSIVKQHNLPLKTVVIKDGNRDLQDICFSDHFKSVIKEKYTFGDALYIQPHEYWKLRLNFKKQSFCLHHPLPSLGFEY